MNGPVLGGCSVLRETFRHEPWGLCRLAACQSVSGKVSRPAGAFRQAVQPRSALRVLRGQKQCSRHGSPSGAAFDQLGGRPQCTW